MSKDLETPMITEVQIYPVKPHDGLVAFTNFVLFKSLYCSCVAIFTRPQGGYRLVYPTKRSGKKDMDVFHPIGSELGKQIEQAVLVKYHEVTQNDRHSMSHL